MSICIIAAIGRNLELGKNNDLIWHFKEDMRFFKETTTGNAVIMGRKTFESLPKALPNRQNIVISSNADYEAQGAQVVCDINQALNIAESENVFVIGGGRVYFQYLPLADKLYLTEIEDSCDSADTFFPSFNKNDYEKTLLASHEVNGIKFNHVLYSK